MLLYSIIMSVEEHSQTKLYYCSIIMLIRQLFQSRMHDSHAFRMELVELSFVATYFVHLHPLRFCIKL